MCFPFASRWIHIYRSNVPLSLIIIYLFINIVIRNNIYSCTSIIILDKILHICRRVCVTTINSARIMCFIMKTERFNSITSVGSVVDFNVKLNVLSLSLFCLSVLLESMNSPTISSICFLVNGCIFCCCCIVVYIYNYNRKNENTRNRYCCKLQQQRWIKNGEYL